MRDILNVGTFGNEFCTLTLICFSTINSLRRTRLAINAILFERFTAPSLLNMVIPLRTVVSQIVVLKYAVKWLQFEISLVARDVLVRTCREETMEERERVPGGRAVFSVARLLTG